MYSCCCCLFVCFWSKWHRNCHIRHTLSPLIILNEIRDNSPHKRTCLNLIRFYFQSLFFIYRVVRLKFHFQYFICHVLVSITKQTIDALNTMLKIAENMNAHCTITKKNIRRFKSMFQIIKEHTSIEFRKRINKIVQCSNALCISLCFGWIEKKVLPTKYSQTCIDNSTD